MSNRVQLETQVKLRLLACCLPPAGWRGSQQATVRGGLDVRDPWFDHSPGIVSVGTGIHCHHLREKW